MACDNIIQNNDCACTSLSCSLRGKCCECVRNHLSKNQVPGCFFTKEAELTYDRSFAAFIKDRSK